MSFKKFLESCGVVAKSKRAGFECSDQVLRQSLSRAQLRDSGQAIVEYFILLVLLTAISIIGSSVFFKRVQDSVINFEGNCINKLGLEFTDYSDWAQENPWWNVLRLEGGGGDELGGEERGGGGTPNW